MKDSGLHCSHWHKVTPSLHYSFKHLLNQWKPLYLCVLDIFPRKGSPALWRHLCISWYAGMRDNSLGLDLKHSMS